MSIALFHLSKWKISLILLFLMNLGYDGFTQTFYYHLTGNIHNLVYPDGVDGFKIQLISPDEPARETISDSAGHYGFDSLKIVPGKTYKLVASFTGYLSWFKEFSLSDFNISGSCVLDFEVSIYMCGTLIRLAEYLPEKMFAKSSSVPSKDLKRATKKIFNTTEDHPTLIISITGYSDYDETTDGDTLLGYNRALAVKNILIKHGVMERRMVARSLGMSKPVVVDVDTLIIKRGTVLNEKNIMAMQSKEEIALAHQLNRRISIEVLRTDFVPNDDD